MSELMILIGSFIILTSFDELTSAAKTKARECGGRPWSTADEKRKKAPKPDSYQPSNCNSYQHDRPFDLDRQYIECEVTCRGFAVGMN